MHVVEMVAAWLGQWPKPGQDVFMAKSRWHWMDMAEMVATGYVNVAEQLLMSHAVALDEHLGEPATSGSRK